MMPEPQMPSGFFLPMVSSMGSKFSGLMRICSIAPVVARMPNLMPPPSKAGPAEQEVQTSQSQLPRTISPLVPTSMNRVSSSRWKMPEPKTPATMSPPT